MWGCPGPAPAAQLSHLPWTRVCTPPAHSIPAAAACGAWRGGFASVCVGGGALASHSDCEARPALRAWGQGHEASCGVETHSAPSADTPTPGSTAPFRHEAWLHCGRPVWAARTPAVLWLWVETSMGPEHRFPGRPWLQDSSPSCANLVALRLWLRLCQGLSQSWWQPAHPQPECQQDTDAPKSRHITQCPPLSWFSQQPSTLGAVITPV